MLPLTRFATVSGKPLPSILSKEKLDDLFTSTKNVAAEVIKLKGATVHAPGNAISSIIESIVKDKKQVMPVSTNLQGEYGYSDVSISRPRRPDEILEEIRRIDSCAARALGAHLEAFRPRLIINQARDHQDARVGSLIQTTSERFLGIPTQHAGVIPYDPMLVRSIKSGKSFMLEYPRSSTARAIRATARQIAEPPMQRIPEASRTARFLGESTYRFTTSSFSTVA